MSRRWLLPLGWSRERCSCRLAFLTRPDGVPADLGRRLGSGVDRDLRPGVCWRPCAPAAGDWLLVALLVLSTAVPAGRYLALATVRTCRYWSATSYRSIRCHKVPSAGRG